MRLELTKYFIELLKTNPGREFTAVEVARWIFENFPEECEEKKANSKNGRLKTDEDLLDQLRSEVYSAYGALSRSKKYPQLKCKEGPRQQYFFWERAGDDEGFDVEGLLLDLFHSPSEPFAFSGSAATENKSRKQWRAAELCPLLSRYVGKDLRVNAMRIDEKRSSNKLTLNGNRWLYPDVVGLENLSSEWRREVSDCAAQSFDMKNELRKKAKLWSFEVKPLINRSNARESFFQAVSNSSWANLGYLVAAEVGGSDTLKELRLLSSAHGIGLIRLNAQNVNESQVLIPAIERRDVDWDMVNRLAVENGDFMDYVKLVNNFYLTGETRSQSWGIQAQKD